MSFRPIRYLTQGSNGIYNLNINVSQIHDLKTHISTIINSINKPFFSSFFPNFLKITIRKFIDVFTTLL